MAQRKAPKAIRLFNEQMRSERLRAEKIAAEKWTNTIPGLTKQQFDARIGALVKDIEELIELSQPVPGIGGYAVLAFSEALCGVKNGAAHFYTESTSNDDSKKGGSR